MFTIKTVVDWFNLVINITVLLKILALSENHKLVKIVQLYVETE